jgi:hypothetical protein
MEHYSMQMNGSAEVTSMGKTCLGPHIALCNRDEFEYDVYGANVVMEAQPIGDRDINDCL